MRVVITGMGVVSPIGSTISEFWESLYLGRSGIRPIEEFDLSQSPAKVAGRIEGFDPLLYLKKKEMKAMDRFSQLGVASAQMAWSDANTTLHQEVPQRVGVLMGTGIGGIPSYAEAYDALYGGTVEKRINAYTIPKIMNNAVSSNIAIHLGIQGRNLTLNTACSSGGNAIGQAYDWIRTGVMDMVLCGGAESPITYGIIKAWSAMGVLANLCQPFDRNRAGFVLSEGAASLVLESLESAQQRGASVYAEIIGFGANCDAYSLTSPSPAGIAKAIQLALENARVETTEVDYINAHGTGTKMNDVVESKVIQQVFGKHAQQLCVSATKSMLGHSMGASSAIEALATVLTVIKDTIPPTINYETPDPECRLNYVPNQAIQKQVKIALSNSFAFGGSNAVLVVKKWEK